MIRIRTAPFAALALLLCALPTVASASVSKPTAEERGACMGDAISLCLAAIPNKDVPTQPALPVAVREGGHQPAVTEPARPHLAARSLAGRPFHL